MFRIPNASYCSILESHGDSLIGFLWVEADMTSKKFLKKSNGTFRYQIGGIEVFGLGQVVDLVFSYGERIRLSSSRALRPASWGGVLWSEASMTSKKFSRKCNSNSLFTYQTGDIEIYNDFFMGVHQGSLETIDIRVQSRAHITLFNGSPRYSARYHWNSLKWGFYGCQEFLSEVQDKWPSASTKIGIDLLQYRTRLWNLPIHFNLPSVCWKQNSFQIQQNSSWRLADKVVSCMSWIVKSESQVVFLSSGS